MAISKDDYFSKVITYEDYQLFMTSGMAFVVYPNTPPTWIQHQKEYQKWLEERQKNVKE